MLTLILTLALTPTPVPPATCVIERGRSGSLEFVCGAGPAAPDGGRRVLVDGVDCGRLYRQGEAMLWSGCERMQRAMERE